MTKATQAQAANTRIGVRRRLRRWKKALGRNKHVRAVACLLISLYIRFTYRSGRWKVIGQEIPQEYWRQEKPFILSFWHGRLLMMPYCWRTSVTMRMLISQHRDGSIIADTIGHFGLGTIRGSASKEGSDKNKGGAVALRAMVRALRSGECVGITPDGPYGPYMRASDGIVIAAKLAGVPIIPATFATQRRRIVNSWDRFCLSFPFSRGVLIWGPPIHVARDADAAQIETLRVSVEESLNRLTFEADQMVNADPIQPAPIA